MSNSFDTPLPDYRLYSTCGIVLRSSLLLPELPPALTTEADVEITIAEIPPHPFSPVESGLRYEAAPGQALITIDEVARFLVLDGSRILIQPLSPSTDDIRFFLYGPVFRTLFQQREEIAWQGSAVAKDGRAMALLGATGVGKSTLAYALIRRGFSLLSDDVCVLRSNSVAARLVQPAVPQIKLWPDVVKKFGVKFNTTSVPGQVPRICVPMNSSFSATALPLHGVYVLDSGPVENVKIDRIAGASAYSMLRQVHFVGSLAKGLGIEASYAQMVMNLSLFVPVTLVVRPKKTPSFEEIVQKIENDFGT